MKIKNIFTEKRIRRERKNYENSFSERKIYLLDEKTPFVITESFRNLKATLSVAIPRHPDGSAVRLMFTSNYPEEGKTTLVVNTALMFAMSDFKVLLIDSDMRRGQISKYFKQHHTPGLSDYLSGQASLDEVLHQSPVNGNLSVIYQGTTSVRPYELLESAAMKTLVEQLKTQFDYIIYDTAPVRPVSDALALVSLTDGVLLVGRYMKTYEGDLRSALDTLRFSNANVLGVVVNDYVVNSRKLKGHEKKYYSSYYSYARTDEKDDATKADKGE